MQKPLNTNSFAPYTLLQRICFSNTGILAYLILIIAGFTNSATATGFTKNFVVVTPGITNQATYYWALGSGTPKIQGSNLGTFDRGAGSLVLGGESNTETTNGDGILAPQMYYRVYRTGSTNPGGFVLLDLTNRRDNLDGNNTQRWDNLSGPNLISNTDGPGAGVTVNYTLEVYFQGTLTYGGSNTFNFYDNNNDPNTNYRATFSVTGNAPTTWNSASSDGNWFNEANWSNKKVPDATTDVVIPFSQNGRYPTIFGSGHGYDPSAQVRDLRIEGTVSPGTNLNTTGATLTLGNTRLQVYGDFTDANNGFTQQIGGGLFELAGTDQRFSGGRFIDFSLTGGGTKTLLTKMTVTFRIQCVNGVLATNIDNPEISGVDLSGDNARITGESEISYVRGTLRAISMLPATQGSTSTFGNIGVDLTPLDASPGVITVTRYTRFYNGVRTSRSIERSFVFTPSSTSGTSNRFNLVFHYLNRDLVNVTPDELRLFRLGSDGFFRPLDRTSNDATAKTLTRENIDAELFATYTLGNVNNPLPVTLTSFAAVAQGPNALLTWTTAQELNNSGFEVQVSTDGTTFSKLGFVAAASPNSTAARTYQYLDVMANKQGTRYYRLRQLDVDGKENLFAPQSLTFGGALATSVTGYPNPFASEISLALQTATAGQATVSVLDGVGRQVRSWQPTLAAGASNMVLSDLGSLPHGLYVVQVRYNDGQTQRLKVVKE